jgi:ribosomal protein L40E
MKQARELLKKMIVEANNVDNPSETRQICRECAEWIEAVILSPTKPKMRRVPFSWFYEAICGRCGAVLTSDEGDCERCGCKIDWHGL